MTASDLDRLRIRLVLPAELENTIFGGVVLRFFVCFFVCFFVVFFCLLLVDISYFFPNLIFTQRGLTKTKIR